MTEVDIVLPPPMEPAEKEQYIEDCCAALGLKRQGKGTLVKYPNCIHWHYKYGKLSGTLEITLWEQGKRTWFAVQSGRQAPWILEMIPQIKARLENTPQPESSLPK